MYKPYLILFTHPNVLSGIVLFFIYHVVLFIPLLTCPLQCGHELIILCVSVTAVNLEISLAHGRYPMAGHDWAQDVPAVLPDAT